MGKRISIFVALWLVAGAACGSDDAPGGTSGSSGQGGAAKSCGNGLLDPGEECDLALPAGVSCAARLGNDSAEGMVGCTLTCQLDLSPCHRCGDGVVNGTEKCDGKVPVGTTCALVTGDESATGTVGCSAACQLDLASCHYCGNGVVDAEEECDVAATSEATCALVTGDASATGTVGCSAACQLDLTSCHYCGDGVVEGQEQCEDDVDVESLTCASFLQNPKASGSLYCSDCKVDTSYCGICGDGKHNGDEDCDGTDSILCSYKQEASDVSDIGAQVPCSDTCHLIVSACPSCSDGKKNGMETDIDCGGVCDSCEDCGACSTDLDCDKGLSCQGGLCHSILAFGPVKTVGKVGSSLHLQAIDFNGDGHPDLVVGGQMNLTVLLSGPDATVTPLLLDKGIVSQNYILPLAVGDFDGDGKNDIWAADLDAADHPYLFWKGKGDGQFSLLPPTPAPLQLSLEHSVVGDFNGDGKLDVAASGIIAGTDGSVLFRGKGDGSFHYPQAILDKLYVESDRAADLDGDGHLDLVATSDAKVVVLFGKGDGTFQVSSGFDIKLKSYLRTPTHVADLDADGHLDVALVVGDDSSYNSVSLLRGKGQRQFDYLPKVVELVPAHSAVSSADLNGDGHLDLFAGTAFALGTPSGTLKPLIPNGQLIEISGALYNRLELMGGEFVWVTDYNGDQRPDLGRVHENELRIDLNFTGSCPEH